MDRPVHAVGAGHDGLHRLGIFGAEIKDMADLDAARGEALAGAELGEGRGVMLLGRGRVERRPFVDNGLQAGRHG